MSEDKPTTPAQLRKENTKLFKTTSGHTYKIRKMPLLTMANFLSIQNIDDIDTDNIMAHPETAKKLLGAINDVIPVCVIDPMISLTYREDAVQIEDIPTYDLIELFTEIVKFSGYSDKTLQKFPAIPEEQPWPSSPKPGEVNGKTTE